VAQTKYIGGHSDVVAGLPACNNERHRRIHSIAEVLGGPFLTRLLPGDTRPAHLERVRRPVAERYRPEDKAHRPVSLPLEKKTAYHPALLEISAMNSAPDPAKKSGNAVASSFFSRNDPIPAWRPIVRLVDASWSISPSGCFQRMSHPRRLGEKPSGCSEGAPE